MLSNDLLSYSIMQNGDKAVVHTLPHYASLASTKPQTVSLPPITSYVSLTENNLKLLNSYLHKQSFVSSAPPSLTLLSLALELPLASPRLANSSFSDSTNSFRIQNSPISSHSHSSCELMVSPQKKRRQRLGPSCDNCRSRKVKCNADVVMISRHFTGENDSNTQNHEDDLHEYTSLSPIQKEHVLAGEPVQIESNYVLILSNYKLIKYKPCMSCANKGFTCCFSKGFTKEDIVQSKRHSSPEDMVSPRTERSLSVSLKVQKRPILDSSSGCSGHGKLSTRKSSCAACRKRKVKCVMMSSHGKCVGCAKKDTLCTF